MRHYKMKSNTNEQVSKERYCLRHCLRHCLDKQRTVCIIMLGLYGNLALGYGQHKIVCFDFAKTIHLLGYMYRLAPETFNSFKDTKIFTVAKKKKWLSISRCLARNDNCYCVWISHRNLNGTFLRFYFSIFSFV